MKTISFSFLAIVIVGLNLQTAGQGLKAINNNVTQTLAAQGSSHELFKLYIIHGIRKGTSAGLSFGMWKEYPVFQYSLNTGFMIRFGKGFLGNYRNGDVPKDPRTKGQLVFMFSPLLTCRFAKEDNAYQEIEAFYSGTPNAVFSKFAYSITVGSTFTITPRGTYKNVSTVRNRTQQDFMVSLNLKNFNLTIYDDYFPVFTELLELGDNWDRFFTGGGFIRYRFNDEFTAHLYSEVYTGINRSNSFLYPDVITYRKKGRRWIRKNFANQDPGQEYFNSSWLVAKLSYTSPQQTGTGGGIFVPDVNVFVGTSAPWTMFSQNWIHNTICYDDENHLKLHYFMPRTNIPGNLEAGGKNAWISNVNSMFIGGGISYNIIRK